MLARVGNVLFWAGNVIAALMLCGAVIFFFAADRVAPGELAIVLGIFAAVAVAVWLLGRASLYILAGR
jgi:hypothetical protein